MELTLRFSNRNISFGSLCSLLLFKFRTCNKPRSVNCPPPTKECSRLLPKSSVSLRSTRHCIKTPDGTSFRLHDDKSKSGSGVSLAWMKIQMLRRYLQIIFCSYYANFALQARLVVDPILCVLLILMTVHSATNLGRSRRNGCRCGRRCRRSSCVISRRTTTHTFGQTINLIP